MTKSLYGLVGMQHRGPEMVRLVASLPNGEPLTLVRERDNKFDPNAVQVWARNHHIGYLKGSQVRPVAMALDSGKGAAWVKPIPVTNAVTTAAAVPPDASCEVFQSLPATLAIDGGKWPLVEVEE